MIMCLRIVVGDQVSTWYCGWGSGINMIMCLRIVVGDQVST